MVRASILYAGEIWSRMWRAPVHQVSDSHCMVGTTAVVARWWMVPGASPFFLITLLRRLDPLRVFAATWLAWILKLKRLSIRTPRTLRLFVGSIWVPYRVSTVESTLLIARPLVKGMRCMSPYLAGEYLMFRYRALSIVSFSLCWSRCFACIWVVTPCIISLSLTYAIVHSRIPAFSWLSAPA